MTTKEMKTCIKEFLKHVEDLEGEEDPDGCGFHREYRLLHEAQIKNRRENVFKFDAGKESSNLNKNRYKDILPYDDHRVILTVKEGDDEGSDYINASLLKGVKGSGGYIGSQGPLAATTKDFWRMIWEKNVEVVFMACRIVENGKIKCKQYWNDIAASDDFGDINVLTESAESISSDFVQRKFKLTRGEEERTVVQFHYSGWPDHGIPDDPVHIRDLIAITRQTRQRHDVPLLVHCSAGCGRTGAIISIDYVWTLLEEGRLDEKFSLYELVSKFREQRMSFVQTPDQYALVYRVLKSLCEDWLIKMASHTYVNVEVEEDYVNIGPAADKQEEHIYEDSSSLAETIDSLKSEGNSSVYADVNKKSNSAKPENTTSESGNYMNTEFVNGKLQVKEPKLPPKEINDGKVLHKTVIQIGAAPKSPPPGSAGDRQGQKEVVNLIKADSVRGRKSVSKTMSAPAAEGGASMQPRVSGVTRKQSKSIKESGSQIVQVPDQPPGFDNRLPRVRGPIPQPARWNQY